MNIGNAGIAILFAGVALFLLLALLSYRDFHANRTNKLPLTKRYLRPPGESLRLKLEKLDERIVDMGIWLVALGAFFACGVYAFLTTSMIVGIAVIGLSLGGLIWWAFSFEKHKKLRRDHYLGFLGERPVGEELSQLMSRGWNVFHDVPFADNPNSKPFNVDHVVVGLGGLYAIETKTRRKRKGHNGHEVTYDGQTLAYPWGSEDWGIKDATERAKQLSKWLSKALKADIQARPVLALPGWYVKRLGKSDLAIVSDGEIAGLFRDEHSKEHLNSETVNSICALLDQRCRDVCR